MTGPNEKTDGGPPAERTFATSACIALAREKLDLGMGITRVSVRLPVRSGDPDRTAVYTA